MGKKSSLHTKIYNIIKELYPLQPIIEEYTIKTENRKSLYVDIYLPRMGLMIECDGIQHYTFTPRFHNNRWCLHNQKLRDEEKEIWCKKHNKILVRFSYQEEEKLSKEYVSAKIREKIGIDN